MSLLQTLQNYQSAVAKANGLIATAHTPTPAGALLLSADERAMIVEAAFLRFFIAWEAFIEQAFLLFMMGTPSAAGNTITRFISPITLEHANKIAIGNLKFVDWSTPDTVRKLSHLFFDRGEPFQTITSSINSDWLDLKTIRNAAAHLSSTTTFTTVHL